MAARSEAASPIASGAGGYPGEALSPATARCVSPEGLRTPKRAAVFSCLLESDGMRQVLIQSPVLRHRKSLPLGAPVSLRGDEAPRVGSPAVGSCLGSQASPGKAHREVLGARSFPARARSASPSASEAFSPCYEPRAASPEERNTKVRGAGGTNYRRSIGSAGIPWRQIPNLDRPNPAAEPREGEGVVRLRSAGQFSPKLGSGEGMRDILGSTTDGSFFKTPPPADGRKEAGGDAAASRPACERSPAKQRVDAKSGAQRLEFGEPGGREPLDKSGLHFTYKQMKKGVNHELQHTKDSCPFHRADAPSPSDASDCSPKRRTVAGSPQASLAGAAALPKGELEEASVVAEELSVAPEKSVESRRDWQATNFLRKPASGSRTPVPLQGLNLSPRLIQALEKPMHPVRQRATLPGCQRWK